MVLVILVSRKIKINPDNIATPIAASLGDLTTLSLLAGVSMLLYKAIGIYIVHVAYGNFACNVRNLIVHPK
jgi:solute carrier family 41